MVWAEMLSATAGCQPADGSNSRSATFAFEEATFK